MTVSEKYYRIGEAAKLLCVTPQTVRKYARQGKIKYTKTPGGQTIYLKSSIDAYLRANENIIPEEKIGFYLRTSDYSPSRIQEQERQLKEIYGQPKQIYKDTASGLNENRKGLKRLLDDAQNGVINKVVITQQDRLTRFGYTYIKRLLAAYGCSLEAAFDNPNKTLQEELIQDFMKLIASFSGKYYRLRGYQQKKQLLDTAETILADEEAKHDDKTGKEINQKEDSKEDSSSQAEKHEGSSNNNQRN